MFGQYLKGPDGVNQVKGAFSQYVKTINFGFVTAPIPCNNLPRKIRVFQSVLAPSMKNISDNINPYFPRHCANVGPQIKVIEFERSSSPVLASPTLRLIISIDATYHLIIGIADVTNSFHDTLKYSSEQ